MEDLEHPFFNRELSWLAFNARVLEQSQNKEYPLLERVRYLAFFSSNLDEFFEIRVAGLLQQMRSSNDSLSIDGKTARQQFEKIQETVNFLVEKECDIWTNELLPELKKEGIIFKAREELSSMEKHWLEDYYEREVFPVLTPLAVDFARPFPQLINKGLNILVSLHNDLVSDGHNHNGLKLAIIPVPRILPRIVQVNPKNRSKGVFVFLSEVLRKYADRLFPGYKLKGAWAFRTTKNSDLYIDEEEVENLLYKIEEELHNLHRGATVRLEIRRDVDPEALHYLLKQLELTEENVTFVKGPLNYLRLFSLYDLLDRPDLKFEKYTPYVPEAFAIKEKIFDSIKKEDQLLHHPYDSFGPVIDFLEQAAEDSSVLAIKLTLYRTSGDTPIVEALKKAALDGKQVTVLVELKARFDEANNIARAKELEEVGVHVVYGMPGLKTHCKCCLVIRKENGGLQQYVHMGTGNYNSVTARTYTDLSFFTADKEIAEEIGSLFNALTGFSKNPEFNKLLIAPFNLHSQVLKLIKRETLNAKAGKKAKIIAKLNSLAERDVIRALYEASGAGVKVYLIIRGICCLIPGVSHLSENIQVKSILGRYLEHSRIYYFENEGNADIFVGSADWMARNFLKRIEVVFPIHDKKIKKRIIEDMLEPLLRNKKNSHNLLSNGLLKAEGDGFCAQEYFASEACKIKDSSD